MQDEPYEGWDFPGSFAHREDPDLWAHLDVERPMRPCWVCGEPTRWISSTQSRYRHPECFERVVLVCGGRDYDEEHVVDHVLSAVVRPGDIVLDGQCPYGGADELAHLWAKANGRTSIRVPAKWGKQGRAAGPKRNQRMLDEAKPAFVVAFPGGRGTADMTRRARKAGVPVLTVDEDGVSEWT